jgi:hypothetical protein
LLGLRLSTMNNHTAYTGQRDPINCPANQPKPASGEWTWTWLYDKTKTRPIPQVTLEIICDLHNAAIAAERGDAYTEGYNKAVGQWLRGEPTHSDKSYHPDCPCPLCRNQLRPAVTVEMFVEERRQNKQLRQQLAAAVEALQQIGLVAESRMGNAPQTKLDDIAKRCQTELAKIGGEP